MGLKGTGSCDIAVDDAFVPERLSVKFGATTSTDNPLFRLGLPASLAFEHAGFALGIGRRSIELVVAAAPGKKRGVGPTSTVLAARGAVQEAIGRAEMRLRSARALTMTLYDDIWQRVCAGETIGTELQVAARSVATHCTEVALDVTAAAFRIVGGSAIYRSNELQRCLRDIHAAAQHQMVSTTAYELLGRTVLGDTPTDLLG